MRIKGADPERQRFEDPEKIHGSQRQMKNVGDAWVENRCLRPEGRIKIQSGSRTPIVTPHNKVT